MKNSDKKKPLHNEFTDALGKEMAERKISERMQTSEKISKKNVDLEEVEVDEFSFGEISVEEVAEEEVKSTKNPAEKISLEKNIPPQTVKIETDPKLEQRILEEADNTFFDEKTTETSDDAPPKSAYHSKILQKLDEEKNPPKVESESKVEPPRKTTRAEKFGMVVSVAMLIYSYVTLDKPLYFLSLSLIVNFFRPLLAPFFGKHNPAAQNALRTFGIVLFFGALFFLFTGQ